MSVRRRPLAHVAAALAAALVAWGCGADPGADAGADGAIESPSDGADERVALEGGDVPQGVAGASPSVLIVTIDTIRADHLGFLGYPRDTSPFLDRFASEAVVFERAYAPIATTLPSHTTMFTGVHPHEHGVLANIYSGMTYVRREHLTTLAELFQDAGYSTAAIVSCAPLRADAGLADGFAAYDGPKRRTRAATEVTEKAIAAMAEQVAADAPGFVWAHYYDPHAPYEPPPTHAGRFTMDDEVRARLAERRFADRAQRRTGHWNDLEPGIDAYDGEVAYVDRQVQRLVRAGRRTGWIDDTTIVVVAGDHGEGLNQHDNAGHGLVWEEQLRVPLLIRAPGVAPRRIATPVTLADLAPTLLHLVDVAGKDAFLEQVTGVNRFLPVAAHADLRILGQTSPRHSATGGIGYSLRAGRWKLHRSEDGVQSLYDLDADPFELEDVARREPRVVTMLGAELDATLAAQRGEIRTEEASDEVRGDLESLGYGGEER